ncbi:MAG TPA: SRPBCC domain-containing protein [Rhizomicrobium sp.]|nr:SRPBCC domain-containing protein [Rhizomicrobium sp.]
MKKTLALSLATMLLATAAEAQVKDTSFVDSSGHRVQQLEAVIAAPADKVWNAFVTDKGFASWAAPVAHVTLANDGMIEASYDRNAKIGDPDNIRNRIVAYVPGRLLVLANDHAPKSAPFSAEAFSKIRTVIEFQDLGDGKTRVIESGVGYGDGADFDGVYKHFRAGNAYEFQLLSDLFTKGPVDWSKME